MKNLAEVFEGRDSDGRYWSIIVEDDDNVQSFGKFRDKFDAWDKANEKERNRDMRGSDKQIKWAEGIKASMQQDFDAIRTQFDGNAIATTAKGAKAEATRTLGKGYHHHTLVIAIEHEDGQIEEIASKPMIAKKWLNDAH